MKILLKKILEKLVLVILFLVIIFGNVLLIYNLQNKFVSINEKFNIAEVIDNSLYISVKDIPNGNTILIDSDEKKDNIKDIFNKIKIRESKLNVLDKQQRIDYSIFIVNSEGKDLFINIANKEVMLYDTIYETDFKINENFETLFK